MFFSSIFRSFAVTIALSLGVAHAAPTSLNERSVTTLSASDLASLAPYTQFARAAYCPSGLKTWTCGGVFYFSLDDKNYP